MRLLQKMSFLALASGLAFGQAATTSAGDPGSVAAEIKAMREALAAQQKQIAEQQQQIEKLQKQVTATPDTAATVPVSGDSTSARVVDASLRTPSPVNVAAPPVQDEQKESPLSFRIGGAQFTPGGFMDFTSIFRTTNEGTLGTNFFSIPFNTLATGHLTEERFTAQNSRLSLKAGEKFGNNDVAGYVEMDFLGNDGANIEVTSNSHTLRQRLYFVDVKHDKWEVVAGQMWGWLTPNRVGTSSYSSDVFYSMDMDFNYQVGLTWTRQPGVRFIYHPNENLQFGVSLENPEQFGGQGEISFPAAANLNLTGEIDSAAGGTAVPNLHPDIIPKVAYDTTMNGKHFHVEAAGLISGFKISDIPSVPGATFVSHTKEGFGGEAAVNLEVFKNFRLVSNAFWSDGGGRYIFGMAPDLVVAPVNAAGATCAVVAGKAAGCDAAISLVHSGSGIVGFEYAATPKFTLFSYYGAMYAQRNSFPDLTSTVATQPFVGFGGPGSPNTNNRAIQEPSLGFVQTFWKQPQYGALQLIAQGSYLTRSPWFVATTPPAPKNAHNTMVWLDLRYVLP